MAQSRKRRDANIGEGCEGLEPRQLLAVAPRLLPAAAIGASNHAGPPLRAPSIFIEPQAGTGPIVQAINSARSQIRLGICNLSDPIIANALAAAVARGVKVQVIVDRADYDAKAGEREVIASLMTRNVPVHLSNSVFPQSFEKELVIDQRQALVMTMCLVPDTFTSTRDYGLVTGDRGVIREITSVFDTDWSFSAPPGATTPLFNPTPPISNASLIWGPPTATAKLSQLIQSARRSIDVTTELLSDPYFEGQLIAARKRGVQVRVLLPAQPREGPSNVPQIRNLTEQGVQARVSIGTEPPPGVLPYMHAKTMVVDGRVAYLGSIDLDTTERSQDRELGIIFRQPRLVSQLRNQFQSDWNRANPPPNS